jgi:hypothetical protein
LEEKVPNIMDIYNLDLSNSDAESTDSDCDSDNGMSNVIVEATYNVKSQKQSETLPKFKSQDDLMGYRDVGRSENPVVPAKEEKKELDTSMKEEIAVKSSKLKKSTIWSHFNETWNHEKAECKHCKKIVACKGGSTEGLVAHIRKTKLHANLASKEKKCELDTSIKEKKPVRSIPGKFIAYKSCSECPLHFNLTF